MDIQSLVHGSISIVLTAAIVYYLYRTIQNIKGSEKTAISHFFLMEEAAKSFKYLFQAAGIYALVALSVASGIVPDGIIYDAAVVLLFLGMLYFSRAAYQVTSGPSKED